MKSFHSNLLILGLFLVTTNAFAGKGQSPLEESIEDLKLRIVEARKPLGIRAVKNLQALSVEFDQLKDESDPEWAALNITSTLHKWSDQTWKDAIGSYLFYPTYAEEFFDSPYKHHLLARNDVIGGFLLAAAHKDPKAKYHLSYILSKIWKDNAELNEEEQKPDFYAKLHQEAVTAFKSVENDFYGLYMMGIESSENSLKTSFFHHDTKKAEEYFKKIMENPCSDNSFKAKSTLQLLHMKEKYRAVYTAPLPTAQDYEKVFSDYGYVPSLMETIRFEKEPKRKKEKLEKIMRTHNYLPAHISLGIIEKLDTAEMHFKTAGEAGISNGYIRAGTLLVGPILDKKDSLIKLKRSLIEENIFKERVQKAEGYFKIAGAQGDYEGYNHLVALYTSLHKMYKDETYIAKIDNAIKESANLKYRKIYNNFISANAEVEGFMELHKKIETLIKTH